jgi:hypothetical protein
MSNGICSGSYNYITSASTCESAASYLGLVDKIAGSGSSSSSPYGCYYRAASSESSRLWINPSGSYGASSTERTALCVYSPYYSSSGATKKKTGPYQDNDGPFEGLNEEDSTGTDETSKANTSTTLAFAGGACVLVAAVAFVVHSRHRRQAESDNNELGLRLELATSDAEL